MKNCLYFVLVSFFIFSACSADPRIDTSSDEKMKASVDAVRASLPEDKRTEFDEALNILAFSSIDIGNIFNPAGKQNTEEKMKQAIQGKTGEEVIAAAERIMQERAKKEKEQALQEIEELKQKQADAEAARGKLAAFKVLRSRYFIEKHKYGMDQPIIELKVENNTKHPVSHAYFKGKLASPGRAVPWLREDFNYSIPGGIETGEKADWRLGPNPFSTWGQVKAPKDAILTVEVVRLDGADGEPLFSAEGFDERDAERLEELLKAYPEAGGGKTINTPSTPL